MTVYLDKMTIYKPFEGNTKEEFDAHVPKRNDFLLCHNCGWKADSQEHSFYFSHIKCTRCIASRGVWTIGDNYILKERPILGNASARYVGPDVSISKFLSENSTIPVGKDMRQWKDSKSLFCLMEKIPGESLWSAGMHMSYEEVKAIAKEVVQYLKQLRTFTSTKPEAPDGSPIRDVQLGPDERIHFVTEDVEEWWARTEHRFKETHVRFRQNIKDRYPVKGPYVLTHGDLHATNIMVKDGHVTGIIDWESGGYLPEWWEAVATRMVQPGSWARHLREEWKEQIGPWPEEEVKIVDHYQNCYHDYKPEKTGVMEYHDRDELMACTNYRRYIEESRWGFAETIRQREMRQKKAAEKEDEASAALKTLSLEGKKS
ncbi:uncharacterized protein EAF02_004130 [Botrytis sinoallii]|uniref:uncharacterized protein n=1 Tax=Botrytis sinoallii TaxID=1463999 RepID=UPI0019021389|nr:uncharacterized protein EAF02_004130 [Botrytis sinoallii]KAF7885621.1 hypothetical protein EAF02_004130 [Botrytis sinoallii]